MSRIECPSINPPQLQPGAATLTVTYPPALSGPAAPCQPWQPQLRPTLATPLILNSPFPQNSLNHAWELSSARYEKWASLKDGQTAEDPLQALPEIMKAGVWWPSQKQGPELCGPRALCVYFETCRLG